MKYIDAEKLIAEIEDRLHCNGTFDEVGDSAWHYDQGVVAAYNHIKEFTASLQQEQPNHLEEALELVAEYNLKPYRDGNAWCILLGKDIQSGICGFGDTRLDAMLEFKQEYDSYVKRTHLYPAKAQPVEGLEKEIDDYIEGCLGGLEGQEIASCARYFYELGCRHTAEMYDDIEHERQRAEKE